TAVHASPIASDPAPPTTRLHEEAKSHADDDEDTMSEAETVAALGPVVAPPPPELESTRRTPAFQQQTLELDSAQRQAAAHALATRTPQSIPAAPYSQARTQPFVPWPPAQPQQQLQKPNAPPPIVI